jgi:hypothetical protein
VKRLSLSRALYKSSHVNEVNEAKEKANFSDKEEERLLAEEGEQTQDILCHHQ